MPDSSLRVADIEARGAVRLRVLESNAGSWRRVAFGEPQRPPVNRAVRSTHAVQFCSDDRMLTMSTASFLAEGIAAGEPAVAFATPGRREGMRECLRRRGLDVNYLERQSRLTILDARATLATFMSDGMPDVRKFNHSVRAAVERMCAANPGSAVRASGEMVGLLWQDGNARAAIRLEELWNELAVLYPISLLCSYASGDFESATGLADREALCRLHSHTLGAGSPLNPADTGERDVRAEAEAAKRANAVFLSAMSHELRTPLNAIAGYVELIDLGLHGPVTPAQRDALARIAHSQRQLLDIVNDVLDLARLESGQVEYALEEIDAMSLVRPSIDALQGFFERGDVACDVQLASENAMPLAVVADADKVRKVLLTLLTNAAKITPPGGRVAVSVGPSDSRANRAAITVRDAGPGIAAARMRRVFEPFNGEPRSAQPFDGTGLSLAISRDLARGMGGDLSVESVPGEGSTFTLELPQPAGTERCYASS